MPSEAPARGRRARTARRILLALLALGAASTVQTGAAASAAEPPAPPGPVGPLGPEGLVVRAKPVPPDVVRVQRRLDELGCDAGVADGTTDGHTRAAVRRFQLRTRAVETGTLDAATTRAIEASVAPRCDRRPVPQRSGAGRRIVVSQRQNWVWLVGAGGHVPAQAGMIDDPRILHRGRYRVGPRCGRPARIARNHSANGEVLEHFVRFARCGVGFHRIPLRRGHQIHPDWLLGTDLRRSHGCLRLSDAFARRVWRFGHVGTRVVVVRG